MRYCRTVLALACAMAVSAPVVADKGEFGVRVRGLYMNVDSDTSPNIDVDVEDRWIPEVDLSYWMTDNWALELVLTYPQKHDVSVNGQGIGSIKQIPPTLMLQYHFMPKQTFQPYVGVGLNYTRLTDVDLKVGNTTIDADRNSWGVAVQAGFDYRISRSMYLNFDAKWVDIDTDLSAGGTHIAKLKVDPWLVGVGIGWRF